MEVNRAKNQWMEEQDLKANNLIKQREAEFEKEFGKLKTENADLVKKMGRLEQEIEKVKQQADIKLMCI